MSDRIAVVGSNMVDLITYVTRMPSLGETVEAPRFEMGAGGKGANQAVAAARLGSDILMVSKVGDDVFGQNTIRNFQRVGIDARHVGVVPGVSSGVAPIFVEPSGENRILIIKGANGHLLPADVDAAADDLLGCRLILLQLEVPLETVYHTIAFAARNGKQVLLNPAPATPGLDLAKLRDVTFFTPNRSELALLTSLPTETLAQIETAAGGLLHAGIRTVIATLGSDGVLLVTQAGARHIPAVSVQPVDTTGAGDAFIGSFAHFYALSYDVAEALHWAVRYAALTVTRRGTQKSYVDASVFRKFCAGIAGGVPAV
jgi:ribokinase